MISSSATGIGPPLWLPETTDTKLANGVRVPTQFGRNAGQVSAFADPVKTRYWYPFPQTSTGQGDLNWSDVPPSCSVWLFYTDVGSRNNMDIYYASLAPDMLQGSSGYLNERQFDVCFPNPLKSVNY